MTTRPQGTPVGGDPASGRARGRRKALTAAVVAVMAMSVAATALTVGAASAAPAAAATSSPLVKYDFNDGTGTTAKDSSGNAFDGTLTGGASWAANGKNYDAVKLDGSSGYVNIPNGPLKDLHDVTMSVDVNLASNKGNDWLGTLGYSTSGYIGMDADAGTLNSYYTNAGKTYEVSTPAPAVGSWANVTLVISSTGETMSVYLNGVLKKTTTGLTGDVSTLYDATKTTGGSVGKSVWGGDPYLDATVDDFRVYGSALSDSDVAALAAAAPVVPATPNPVTVATSPGVAPSLPSTVDVPFTDGTNQSLPVTWGTVDPSQYADAGTFTVKGTTGGASSLEATVTVYVLPKPVLTTSAKTGTSVSLKWDAQDNATAYTLLRSTTSGSGYQQVYQGADANYTDSGLSLGTNYYYILNYTVTGGGTSVNSAELPVKTDTELVGPPTVTQSSYLMTNRVDLSWSAVALSDSYTVYRSDSADGPYTELATVTGTSYKDSDVDQGSTYYYEVSCVNDAGEGPKSDALKARTAVDTVPPTTVTSSAQTDSTITLDWVAKDGAITYNLYRTTTSGSGYSLVHSGDALTYTDKNLVTGSTYYYVVTYTSSLGTSINSKELKVATVAVKVPAPSAIKLVTPYTNAAKLSWNSVVGATSFTLYRSTSADGTYSAVKTLTGNTYTDTGLSPGTTYYYELTSVNAAGESAPSAPFKVTTDTGTSTILTNKTTWYDDDGNPIQAGSGDIIQSGDTYYWYGGGNGGPFDVNVYSSQDLVHWKFENKVLTTGSLGEDGKPAADLSASSGNHLERIKVIYNASTKKYVMISHYENSDYTLADIGTAESSSPTGDFTWDHSFRPAGLDSRDSTAYVDSDGTGYIISATLTNSKVTLFKLTSDYLSVDKQMYNIYGGDNSSSIYSGREAPAMVKDNGVYYLVTSSAAGWYPSDAMYSVATADSLADTTVDSWTGDTNVDAMGGWDGGGMADYLGNRNDFGGQSVYIVPVTGTHGTSYLMMNDTLDPKASGVGGPLWLPLKLDDGVATVDYSEQIDINAKAGEISNVYPGSLLSQGKPATASSADTTDSDGNVNPDGWTGQYANDGNYNTEWKASSSSYPAWWQVDLGQEYNINDVQLSWWMIGGSEATEDFQIQVSDDGQNWSVGYDMSSGDKQYGFNDCTMPSVEGRYVRVMILASHTQNNNGGWYVPQLYEARVYGDAAPSSATVTTPDSNGNYSLQVPANIANYPATGDYTLGLGNVAVDFPTSDLLSNLGHGTLTATNGRTSADTLSAVTAAAGADNKVVSTYDLSLAGADGTNVASLASPAVTTVRLTSDQVASLSASGVTPKLFRYDPGTDKLVDAGGTFDLANGTVSYDLSGFGTYVLVASGGTPTAPAITVTKAPALKGTAQVGKELSVTEGTYGVKGATVAYQWLRDGTAVKGATGARYTLTPADYQAGVSARVTASKSGYTDVATTTAPTTAVAAGEFKVTVKPAVTGTPQVGRKLSATAGTYSVKGVSATYEWLRDGSPIDGATDAKYTVTSADKKARLSVQVTASLPGYGTVVTTTGRTAAVS